MKVVIIGASGLVGSHLANACNQRNWQVVKTHHSFPQTKSHFLEIEKASDVQLFLEKHQPNIVFLPAFCSNVDYCEQNQKKTYETNVTGSLNVTKATLEVGAKLVFYSSDYVFDGKSGPYRETDQANPICVYGKHKLEIEQKIAQLTENYLILRITVVYGYEAQGKNFLARMIKNLRRGQEIKVPKDQIGSPTLVNDIAEASCRLVEADATGLFHIAGSDVINRYQFALEIANIFELPTENIIPVTTPELGQAAKRPLKAGMVCEPFFQNFFKLQGVAEGLRYLKENSTNT